MKPPDGDGAGHGAASGCVTRPAKDDVFLAMAREIARLSTCPRALAYGGMGAVLVERDTHLPLGFGYCGSPPGERHCTDAGCVMIDGGCARTLHCEANAMRYARPSDRTKVLYITASPCVACLAQARGAGVVRVVYGREYRVIAPVRERAAAWGIDLVYRAEENYDEDRGATRENAGG